MWKQIKRARKTETIPFPGRIEGKNGSIVQGTKKVLNELKTFYEDISENRDEAAIRYNKPRKFGPNPPKGTREHTHTEYINMRDKEGRRPPTPFSMCDYGLDKGEIRKAIMKANSDSTTESDAIQTKAVQIGIDQLLPHLTVLFNAMWDKSFTPSGWQVAITKLLHKKGPTTNMANYRPITLLTTFSRYGKEYLTPDTPLYSR